MFLKINSHDLFVGDCVVNRVCMVALRGVLVSFFALFHTSFGDFD